MKQNLRVATPPAVRSLVVTVATLAWAVACGGSSESGAAAPTATPYPPYPSATAPAPTGTVAAAPTTPPPPAAPTPLDEVTKGALQAMLAQRASKEAAGMKPVGEPFGAQIPQGMQFESGQFMIDLGKCYTVLAQGGLGLGEVNVELQGVSAIQIPGMTSQALAIDNTTGPQAAIAPCWKNAYPIGFPGKAVIKVTGGSGPVLAQVYVK